MFSRLSTSVLALVFGVSALAATGCAAPTGDVPEESSGTETTGTTTQALDPMSLVNTASQFGQKLGPALSTASFIYGLYQNVPGKLDAMNTQLATISGGVTKIQAQLDGIDKKLDTQFQAQNIAPLGTAENFIAIDMKNLMENLPASGFSDTLYSTNTAAIGRELSTATTAGQAILENFAPEGVLANTMKPAEWFRVYGIYLRASLVKIALRDAQANLEAAYDNNASTPDTVARKNIAIANYRDTIDEVTPNLVRLRDLYIAARRTPLANTDCFYVENYYYQVDIDWLGQPVYGYVTQQSFKDEGAQYQSPPYLVQNPGSEVFTMQCQSNLRNYQNDMLPKIDAFVWTQFNGPIVDLNKIPSSWDGK
jgi:hypothetical protein